MRAVRRIALFVALSLIGAGGTVSAQSSGKTMSQPTLQAAETGADCSVCAHNLDTSEHWFTGSCSVGSSDCYDCHVFNACHSGPQAGFFCSVSHWACGTQAALDAVGKALKGRDPKAALLMVANRFPKKVQIVAGGYLLVAGCKGGVAAAYKLPPTAVQGTAPFARAASGTSSRGARPSREVTAPLTAAS